MISIQKKILHCLRYFNFAGLSVDYGQRTAFQFVPRNFSYSVARVPHCYPRKTNFAFIPLVFVIFSPPEFYALKIDVSFSNMSSSLES